MKIWVGLALILFTTCVVASDLPAPVKALESKGLVIHGEMPAPPGFKGYVAEYNKQRMPLYLLPDGKHMVIGNLFDAEGRDLTTRAFAQAAKPALDATTWQWLQDSTWIAEGSPDPERVVYVFSDTECPFCHRLWNKVQPLLSGGKVQVRYIMVAVIRPESLGRAAAVLSAKDPSATLREHEAHYGNSPIAPMQRVPPALQAKIAANNRLMNLLGTSGTPAIVYRDGSGKLHMIEGLPSDPSLIKSIFGS